MSDRPTPPTEAQRTLAGLVVGIAAAQVRGDVEALARLRSWTAAYSPAVVATYAADLIAALADQVAAERSTSTLEILEELALLVAEAS